MLRRQDSAAAGGVASGPDLQDPRLRVHHQHIRQLVRSLLSLHHSHGSGIRRWKCAHGMHSAHPLRSNAITQKRLNSMRVLCPSDTRDAVCTFRLCAATLWAAMRLLTRAEARAPTVSSPTGLTSTRRPTRRLSSISNGLFDPSPGCHTMLCSCKLPPAASID